MPSPGKDGDKGPVLHPRYPGCWGSRGAVHPAPGTASPAQAGTAAWPRSPAPASGLTPSKSCSQNTQSQPSPEGTGWHMWVSRSCLAVLQLQWLLPWQIQATSVTHFDPASDLQKMLNHQHSEENTHFFCKQNRGFMVFSYQLLFFFLMVWNHKMFLIFIFRGIIVKVYQRLSGHSWQDT